jgi:hypothetical protein
VNETNELPEAADSRGVLRRRFLVSGGALAGGAVVAAASQAAPAAAQTVDNSYVPVGPARVFDTRGGSGPIVYGETFQLATSFNTLVPVPIGVTLNITVTQTVGKGWLALYPSNVTFGGTSNVNWSSDSQDIANNAFVGVAPDGVILISAGGIVGAQADFAIDIMAASVPVDSSTAAASGLTKSLTTPWTLR